MSQQENLSASNKTGSDPSVFLLAGIPGLEAMNLWISIPFSSVFTVALLGNFILLYIIKTEVSLHQPMFYFLTMLAVINLVLSTMTMPKLLSIFWFNSREISFTACLVQMFFLHSFFSMESAVLVAMSFYRYVAICNPLRYTTILTNSVIAKIGLMAFIRGVLLIVPLLFFVRRLPFCQSHIIKHSYCEHMAVVKLACTSAKFNNIYGIFGTIFCMVLDLTFTTLSYIKILRTVLSLVSKEEQIKAFSICVSHLCTMFMIYTPLALTSVIHRISHLVAPHVHILVANLYFLFPPMLNPIVYCAKTKQIHNRVSRLLQRKNF